MPKEKLSLQEQRGNSVIASAMRSHKEKSIQRGYDNDEVIKHPKIYVEAAVEAGIFPEYTICRREFFGDMLRTAVIGPTLELVQKKELELRFLLEDKFPDKNPKDIIDVIYYGVFVATVHGYVLTDNYVANRLVDAFKGLTNRAVNKLLNEHNRI